MCTDFSASFRTDRCCKIPTAFPIYHPKSNGADYFRHYLKYVAKNKSVWS